MEILFPHDKFLHVKFPPHNPLHSTLPPPNQKNRPEKRLSTSQ